MKKGMKKYKTSANKRAYNSERYRLGKSVDFLATRRAGK